MDNKVILSKDEYNSLYLRLKIHEDEYKRQQEEITRLHENNRRYRQAIHYLRHISSTTRILHWKAVLKNIKNIIKTGVESVHLVT